jgi:hypothetical protein
MVPANSFAEYAPEPNPDARRLMLPSVCPHMPLAEAAFRHYLVQDLFLIEFARAYALRLQVSRSPSRAFVDYDPRNPARRCSSERYLNAR